MWREKHKIPWEKKWSSYISRDFYYLNIRVIFEIN
jgi:hypothetical protein